MRLEMVEVDLPLDMKVLNCCECGSLLIGDSSRGVFDLLCEMNNWQPKKWDRLPYLVGRVNDRPYCFHCLFPHPNTQKPASKEDDGGPWEQYAIRCLEDAPADLEN